MTTDTAGPKDTADKDTDTGLVDTKGRPIMKGTCGGLYIIKATPGGAIRKHLPKSHSAHIQLLARTNAPHKHRQAL